MTEYIKKSEVIEMLTSLPRDIVYDHIYELKGIWIDEDAQQGLDEWCTDCKEYDTEKHCCPRWNRVIRSALEEAQPDRKTSEWLHEYLQTAVDFCIITETQASRLMDMIDTSEDNT